MNKNDVTDFINYGKPLTKKAIISILIGDLFLYFAAIYKGYNYKLTLFVLTPFIIVSLILVLIFFIKKYNLKQHIFLFFGMLSVVSSLMCQIGSVCFFPMRSTKMIIFLAVLFLANVFVMMTTVIISRMKIFGNKNGKSAPMVSSGLITTFAALGVVSSQYIPRENDDIVFCIFYAFFSLVFSIFYIYIVKYIYIRKMGES